MVREEGGPSSKSDVGRERVKRRAGVIYVCLAWNPVWVERISNWGKGGIP